MKRALLLSVILFFCYSGLYAQQYQNISAPYRLDGFLGTASLQAYFKNSMMYAKNAQLLVSQYEGEGMSPALEKAMSDAGIRFVMHLKTFGFRLKGQVKFEGYPDLGAYDVSIHLNQSGTDYAVPVWRQDVIKAADAYKKKTGRNFFEDKGRLKNEKITEIYVNDLKNKIAAVHSKLKNEQQANSEITKLIANARQALGKHDPREARNAYNQAKNRQTGDEGVKKELAQLEQDIKEAEEEQRSAKEQEAAMRDAIQQGNSALAKNDVDNAAEWLAKAQGIAVEDGGLKAGMEKLSAAIERKREELEKKEKEAEDKAKEEEEKAETEPEEQEKKASGGSSGTAKKKTEEKKEPAKDKKKPAKAPVIYIPKTATQLYNELKELTDKNPSLLNDAGTRKRLRDYKIKADRESSPSPIVLKGTFTDRSSTNTNARNNYNAYNSVARQVTASNQKMDVWTGAIGDVADMASSAVRQSIAAKAEREKREAAQRKADLNNRLDRIERIRKYDDVAADERGEYVSAVKEYIAKNYDDIYTRSYQHQGKKHTLYDVPSMNVAPVYFDSEEFDGDTKSFVKVRKKMYNSYRKIYIVRMNGQYGLLNDDASVLVAPQFEEIEGVNIQHNNAGYFHSFLVKAEGRWGELSKEGSVMTPIMYDHIWYTFNGIKITQLGDEWGFSTDYKAKLVYKSGKQAEAKELGTFICTTEELSERFSGYIPLINDNSNKSVQGLGVVNYFLSANGTCVHAVIKDKKSSDEISAGEIRLYNAPAPRGESASYVRDGKSWYKVTQATERNLLMLEETEALLMPVNESYYGDYGMIDREGKLVIPYRYKRLGQLSEGLIASDKGYLDAKGDVVIPVSAKKFTMLGDFEHGLALVKSVDYKQGFIDKKGNFVLPLDRYRNVGMAYNELGKKCYKEEAYADAVHWFRKAAENGNSNAQYNLSICYEAGKGVEKDGAMVVKWLTASAERGFEKSILALGNKYQFGGIVDQDYHKAAFWYEKLARRNGNAKANLILCLITLRRLNEAKEWLEGPLEAKNAYAYYLYGLWHEQKNDRKNALRWYKKAIKGGDAAAKKRMDELKNIPEGQPLGVRASTGKIPEGNARVYFIRATGMKLSGVGMPIMNNGNEIVKLGNNSYAVHLVPSGLHEFALNTKKVKAATMPLKFELMSGASYYLKIHFDGKGLNPAAIMLYPMPEKEALDMMKTLKEDYTLNNGMPPLPSQASPPSPPSPSAIKVKGLFRK